MQIGRPITELELRRAAELPRNLATPHRKFLAWRLLCKPDFAERLKPRPVSYVAHMIGTSYAKARMILMWHNWECVPRRSSTDTQNWLPPFAETFAPSE